MKLTPVYRHSPNGRSTRPFPKTISLMQRPRWGTVDPKHPRSAGLHPKIPSALDVGLGSITAWRRFVVPTTILVFVRNAHRVSRNELLLRCVIRRSASQVMRREGLGEHPIDLIDPTR